MTTELQIGTTDGETLEAGTTGPDDAERVIVLAHPHPEYGGDMHHPAVAVTWRGLGEAGLGALRFNFRGAGRSTGSHGGGEPEQLDVRTAVTAAGERWPDAELALFGYSFGADLVRSAGVDAVRTVLVAPPLHFSPDTGPSGPTLILVPEHDQFSPPEHARERTASWPDITIEVVAGADHFLAGAVDRIATRSVEWLTS